MRNSAFLRSIKFDCPWKGLISFSNSSLTKLLFLELGCVQMPDKMEPFIPWTPEILQGSLSEPRQENEKELFEAQDSVNSRHTFSCLINNFTHDVKLTCAYNTPQTRYLETHFQSTFHYASSRRCAIAFQ